MDRDDVISLQDYLAVLRRQRLLVLATVIVVVGAALAIALAQTPVYESSAEVVVEPVRRTQDVPLEDLSFYYGDVVQTERLVLTSRPVAERAAEMLGIGEPGVALEGVRVESVTETRVVRVVAADTDPAAAADKANAFADGYLDYRRDEAVEGLLAARNDLEQRAAGLREEIQAIDDAEDEEVDEVQREALLAQLSSVVAQAAELGDAAGAISGGGSILQPAEVPIAPVAPRPLRTGVLAAVLGLLLGVGLAFLRDHFDDVIRDENDFKRATGRRPVLGRIPEWKDPEGGNRLATVVEPSSLASESYRELSAGVRFLLVAQDDGAEHQPDDPTGRSLLLSSADAGDGKTSTAANLAVAAARVGLRTLLVDADLRRPTVAKRFGIGRTAGLADLLLAGGRVHDYVVPVGVENLLILPAGTLPPNPHELLASAAMRAFERDVRSHADLIIYDTPAVLAVPDALELARHVDVTVLVGRTGKTGRRHLAAAIERLEQIGAEVAGTVLNGLSGKGDAYYYAYYYAQQPQELERLSRRERRAVRKRAGDGSRPKGEPLEYDSSTNPTRARRTNVRTLPVPPDPATNGSPSATDEPLFDDVGK